MSAAELRLRDIASPQVLTVTPQAPLAEVVRLFAERQVSCVVVVQAHKPVGIITERDLLRLMRLGSADTQAVHSLMSAPVQIIST